MFALSDLVVVRLTISDQSLAMKANRSFFTSEHQINGGSGQDLQSQAELLQSKLGSERKLDVFRAVCRDSCSTLSVDTLHEMLAGQGSAFKYASAIRGDSPHVEALIQGFTHVG